MVGINVIIACITLAILMHTEGRELGIKTWLPILAITIVGISCGLPLYLYLREKAKVAISQKWVMMTAGL
jgi:hypothetical protein